MKSKLAKSIYLAWCAGALLACGGAAAQAVDNPNGMILSHAVAGSYSPGEPVEVTLQVDFVTPEGLTALGIAEMLPAGWTFQSMGTLYAGINPNITPQPGTEGELGFAWIAVPDQFPVRFSFFVLPGEGAGGEATLTGQGRYRTTGGELVSEVSVATLRGTDTVPPQITLIGGASLTVERGTPFVDPGARATDNVDGDISNRVQVTGAVNSAVVGTYTLMYTVTDAAGNQADPVTRTVRVVEPADDDNPSGGGGGGSSGGGTSGGQSPVRTGARGYGYYGGTPDYEAAFDDGTYEGKELDEIPAQDRQDGAKPLPPQAGMSSQEAAQRAMAAQAARQQAAAAAAAQQAHLTGPVPTSSGPPLPDPARVAELQRSMTERQREQAARALEGIRPPGGDASVPSGKTDAAAAPPSAAGTASSYPPDAPGTQQRPGGTPATGGAPAPPDSPGASGFLAGMANTLGGLGPSGYARLAGAVVALAVIAGLAVLAWRVAYSPKPGRKNGHAKKPPETA